MNQLVSLVRISLHGLHRRLPMSLVVVASVASVVGVLVSMLAMSAGLNRISQAGARDDRAIVLSSGATSEMRSYLDTEALRVITSTPGIARSGYNVLASSDVVTLVSLARRKGGEANVTLRGVDPIRYSISSELRVMRGRLPVPGTYELIAGIGVVRQFSNLEIGRKVSFRGSEWDVVGTFTASGSLLESTLIVDAQSLLSALQVVNRQSVTVVLPSANAFIDFAASLSKHPSLAVTVRRESEYLAEVSRSVTRLIDFVRNFVVTTMAIGAALAGIIGMHAIVGSRGRELAILRALGFSTTATFISIISEAVLISLLGAAFGSGAALILFEGRYVEAAGVDFLMRVTQNEIALSTCWAVAIGFIGGALPAWHWIRRPPRLLGHD